VLSGETPSIFGLPSFVAVGAGGNKPFIIGALAAAVPGVDGCWDGTGGGGGSIDPLGGLVPPTVDADRGNGVF